MARTVLIVDDAVLMRTMIRDILAAAGFRVVGEATDGREAVGLYHQLRPDLVTMDIVMPELGGVEAVREIVTADPAARILICGGSGQEARAQEALRAGAREFVAKPFHPSRVLDALERVMA